MKKIVKYKHPALTSSSGGFYKYITGELMLHFHLYVLEERLRVIGKTVEDFPDIWDVEYEYEVGDYVVLDSCGVGVDRITSKKECSISDISWIGAELYNEDKDWHIYDFEHHCRWTLGSIHRKASWRPATPEEIEEYERKTFMPRKGTEYWYVGHNNRVFRQLWTGWKNILDRERWEAKNVFFDEDTAQSVAFQRITLHKANFDTQKLP